MSNDIESRRIRANEARQFLQNPLFREAFEGVAEYLRQVGLGCDPDNKEKAQRIVISMQLLEAVKREITRKVEDGDMAEVQFAEIEKRRAFRLFQR
jgi:hypothetical protein